MSLLDELRARLPDDCIQADPDVVAAYAQDRALFERPGTAAVLVMPRDTADVVATMAAARAAGAPVVTRGAGTGLCGGANAVDGCVILSMHRMDRVLHVDDANRTVRVQPGVLNGALKRAVAEHGLFYPPDPASYEISSIGGNIATNAGGLCCVRYGVTRDYVMGLEVVLASGEVIHTGRHTIKSTAGLDLTGVFVGSEGILGVVTEATLKLVPLPPLPCTAVAYFADLPAAGRAILDIFRAGHEPSLMEIVDRRCLEQVNEVYHMDLDTSAACLLLIQSSGDRAVTAIEAMARCCLDQGATDVLHVTDPAEGDMFVEVRRRVWPAFERLGTAMLPEDVAVPRERLAELLAGIVAIGDRHRIDLPTVGHAGDGNMHPVLVFDGADPDAVARAEAAFADIVALALSLGGTIAAEHGIGTLKRRFLADEIEPAHLAWQHRVKATFDPTGMLNPGKAI
ncbi:MAG: FAD-linked oxidase C-terminal domain-containing protein [Ilumatobacteraceae bacterium]|nr:FAD-binding protein [Acidimicrobiales bacterium]